MAEGFTSPVVATSLEDGSHRLLIVDQIGTVHILNADGTLADRLFLDLRPRLTQLNQGFDERGLLGLTFHPRFRENRKFYVYYSVPLAEGAPADWDHTSRVSEFRVTETDPSQVDHASERVVLQIDQPYANHNSGRLAFGPDGFLYIAVGDGGNANDVGRGHSAIGNGQDLTVLLGKILRIDIDRAKPYAIPADNPFQKSPARPEIYAYGLRNPWGMTFDRGGNHDLFVSDVGQTMYEEINIVKRGGNYGWNIREGRHCFDPKNPKSPPEDCPKVGADGQPLLDPIVEYKNINGFRKDEEALGISVTGGYVYRGKTLPELQGNYVFADWSRNWALPDGVLLLAVPSGSENEVSWTLKPLPVENLAGGKINAYITAFGQDEDSELYVLTNGRNSLIGKTGKVYKIVAR